MSFVRCDDNGVINNASRNGNDEFLRDEYTDGFVALRLSLHRLAGSYQTEDEAQGIVISQV